MEWKVLKITNSKGGCGEPLASVGLGRLSLNNAACDLIYDFDKYQYAQLLTAQQESGKSCVGILLRENKTDDCVKINRRKYKGKYVKSFSLNNKSAIQKLFGVKGTQKKVTNYKIEKDNDNPTLLIIRDV